MLALSAEKNIGFFQYFFVLSDTMDRNGEKVFPRLIAANQVLGDVLIYSSNKTTSDIVAAVGVTT